MIKDCNLTCFEAILASKSAYKIHYTQAIYLRIKQLGYGHTSRESCCRVKAPRFQP
jgi:hypothetical protein